MHNPTTFIPFIPVGMGLSDFREGIALTNEKGIWQVNSEHLPTLNLHSRYTFDNKKWCTVLRKKKAGKGKIV